jgi:hypothetical protein
MFSSRQSPYWRHKNEWGNELDLQQRGNKFSRAEPEISGSALHLLNAFIWTGQNQKSLLIR